MADHPRDRHELIAAEHGALIAGLLNLAAGPTPTSPAGMEGGWQGSDIRAHEREQAVRMAAWRRLYEPAPTHHDEITNALPPVRR